MIWAVSIFSVVMASAGFYAHGLVGIAAVLPTLLILGFMAVLDG